MGDSVLGEKGNAVKQNNEECYSEKGRLGLGFAEGYVGRDRGGRLPSVPENDRLLSCLAGAAA
jgi:hypothetical protein